MHRKMYTNKEVENNTYSPETNKGKGKAVTPTEIVHDVTKTRGSTAATQTNVDLPQGKSQRAPGCAEISWSVNIPCETRNTK